MAGTIPGGRAAAKTSEAREPGFYKRIGGIGGRKGHTGGFGSNKVGKDGLAGKQRAATAGALGGRKSRRGKSEPKD